MSSQHSKCDDCYKTHLPEAHDMTILPSEAFSEGYVPEFNQASEGEQRTLDDILSQAFTDGASDTMWQNDKHVEIFATAKKELLAIIQQEIVKARIDELETLRGEVKHESVHTTQELISSRQDELKKELDRYE